MQPHRWVDDLGDIGPEVFVVLDDAVDMHYRDEVGDEHVERRTPDCLAEPAMTTSPIRYP